MIPNKEPNKHFLQEGYTGYNIIHYCSELDSGVTAQNIKHHGNHFLRNIPRYAITVTALVHTRRKKKHNIHKLFYAVKKKHGHLQRSGDSSELSGQSCSPSHSQLCDTHVTLSWHTNSPGSHNCCSESNKIRNTLIEKVV